MLNSVAREGFGPSSTTGAGAPRFDAPGGFPLLVRWARRTVLLAIFATILLLLAGGAWYAAAVVEDQAPTTTAAAGPAGTPPSAVAGSGGADGDPAAVAGASTSTTSNNPLGTSITSTTTPSTTSTTVPDASTTTTTTTPVVVVPTTSPPVTTTTTVPPPPGALVLSSGTIDLGPTAPRARLSLANTGGQALSWSIDGDALPFIWSTTSGNLAPGGTVEVRVAIERGPLAEGSIARSVTLRSSALGTAAVTVTASVEHPPVVSLVSATTSLVCPRLAGRPIVVSVTDESAIAGVELRWIGPGTPGSTPMTLLRRGWTGSLAPAPVNGTWTWEAVATDARGNTGRASAPFVVTGC